MQDPSDDNRALSLSRLNSLIKAVITDALPGQYWVVAEIADIKVNQRGHCYMELVEKEGSSPVAQIRANIWSYEYRSISSRFVRVAGEPLKQGMNILFLASISFHEVYGLSLNIRDIDPAYTMGEMARRKKEVIERLRKEGIIDRNKSLELPPVPQRIAVISSPTAAGYQDFFNHLDNNPCGYCFVHTLFPAMMQGQEAEASILKALSSVRRRKAEFDLAVMIRGGGSVIDLNCFDSYLIAAEIACFPLPVITGIGHEKDDTVADIVAHTKMKTPTAVAEFLIAGMRSFEDSVLGLEGRMISRVRHLLAARRHELSSLAQRAALIPRMAIRNLENRFLMIRQGLSGAAQNVLQNGHNRLERTGQAVRHLDPANVLKRGYSITRLKGRVLKDAEALKYGVEITTELHKGSVTSIVQAGKERKTDGEKQGTDLLPGFE